MTDSITALIITALATDVLSLAKKHFMLSVFYAEYHKANCRYAEYNGAIYVRHL